MRRIRELGIPNRSFISDDGGQENTKPPHYIFHSKKGEIFTTKDLTFYWDDINDRKKKEIIEEFGDNFNWDHFPICTLHIEILDEEEEE